MRTAQFEHKPLPGLREDQNLTQSALAERVTIEMRKINKRFTYSQTAISHIERGVRQPSMSAAKAICKVLGVDEGTLIKRVVSQ